MRAEDFVKLMTDCRNAVRESMPAILFNATLHVAKEMEWRVFNNGQTIHGETLRYRSAGYKKKREKRGRQVGYKDFQMTDNLFNSMAVIESSDTKVVYGFSSAETAKVANLVTAQIDLKVSDVWGLSEKEKIEASKSIEGGVARVINSVVRQYPNKPRSVQKQKEPRKPAVKPYKK
jgi:hypothetical protein